MAEPAEIKEEVIMDMVLIVELQDGGGNKKNPFISYRYPKLVDNADPFSKSVTQFCFPDVSAFPTDTLETDVFSFVLTIDSGDRRFGYCMRKLPPGSGERFPIAFCILSFFPCFPMFAKMLEHVSFSYENESSDKLTKFIEQLIASPLPNPGESFEVTIEERETTNKWRFSRPNEEDSFLEHCAFEPVLNQMDEETILVVFASLLVERRTIFISSKLSLLSSCVQSLLALLYPLAWQHICIPVLPASLLSFCCAPMPFVVGIMPSSIPELLTLPMEEVLIVDVDNHSFLQKPAFVDDYQLLPTDFWTPVMKALKEATKNMKKHKKRRIKIAGGDTKMEAELALYDGKIIGKALADVFLNFFVRLLGNYRQFIVDCEFDKEGFIESQKTWEQKQFMELFCGSQMFEMFIYQRKENKFKESTFEKRVKAIRVEAMASGEESKNKQGKGFFGAFKKKMRSNRPASGSAGGDFVVSQPSAFRRDIDKTTVTPSPASFITSEGTFVVFRVAGQQITNLPSCVDDSSIQRIFASKNHLTGLPRCMTNLCKVLSVDLSHNQFKELPEIIGLLPVLQDLNLSHNQIQSISSGFKFPKSLTALNLDNNELQSLPPFWIQIGALKRLSVRHNQLKELPAFEGKSLKRLLVSYNLLTKLPALDGIKNLVRLCIAHNQLHSIEEVFCLSKLSELQAKANQITSLSGLHLCSSIEILCLDHNRISLLPLELSQLNHLKTFSLAKNQISVFPSDFVAMMPETEICLRKNPCSPPEF